MAEILAKLQKQRRHLEIQVAHEPGVVREIGFQASGNDPNGTKLDGLIIVNREGSNKLIYLIRSLDSIPVCSGVTSGFDDGSRRQGEPCRMDCREDNEGDNTGDGAYLVEPRSFLVISPCAICAAPKATELARSSVAWQVSARTVSDRKCSPLTNLSSVHGGAWSLPRGRKTSVV